MGDICSSLPERSTDRNVGLVKEYCSVYDQLSLEAQKLSGQQKLKKLDEMADVLNQIYKIQWERKNNPNTQNSDPRTERQFQEPVPFTIKSGYIDLDPIGGFADGRYSIVDVQLADTQAKPDYSDEKFLSQGFQRYDIRLKMDRKDNYYTTKSIYVRYEPRTARLYLGFDRQTYSLAVPKNTVTREGMTNSLPGGSRYRETTTSEVLREIDIGNSNAKLHLVIDVGGLR